MECPRCGRTMSWMALHTIDGEPYARWVCDCENRTMSDEISERYYALYNHRITPLEYFDYLCNIGYSRHDAMAYVLLATGNRDHGYGSDFSRDVPA